MKKSQRRSLFRIFLIPSLIFVTSVSGLVAALIVDGKADFIAGLAVAAPVLTLFTLSIRPMIKSRVVTGALKRLHNAPAEHKPHHNPPASPGASGDPKKRS